ncbi:DUF6221 family protein [Streptomyces sp. NPDC052069]|uniref:DUF6221 family protein n=1 Tax=Streptomyces sp. NPDC052069 TaxID=3154650 RepID=UPI00342F9520
MNDLVQFLRDRLAEDERIARAATPSPWEQTPEKVGCLASAEYWEVVDCTGTPMARENAEHVARHDPARVLREVEAKRRRLTRHVPERRRLTLLDKDGGATSFGFYVCTSCTPNRTIEHGQEVVEWPCLDVRDDALPYAGHPDYRDDWRP